jgi:hypothetical protein
VRRNNNHRSLTLKEQEFRFWPTSIIDAAEIMGFLDVLRRLFRRLGKKPGTTETKKSEEEEEAEIEELVALDII